MPDAAGVRFFPSVREPVNLLCRIASVLDVESIARYVSTYNVVCVCMSVTAIIPAKTAEPIENPSGGERQTLVGGSKPPRHRALYESTHWRYLVNII